MLEHAITLTGHTGRAYRVAFSSDGRMLASCGYELEPPATAPYCVIPRPRMVWLW